LWAAAFAALAATPLRAANIAWEDSSTGPLMSANYYNGTTTGNAPTAADVVHIGQSGTAELSSGDVSFQKLRVGHRQVSGYNGSGTVTVSNGATIDLTAGSSGAGNASLWVGQKNNGTLNIDGAGSSVTAKQLIVVGYGNNLNHVATINITDGGSLTATAGNVLLGEESASGDGGQQGHVFVNGNLSVDGGGADLNIGVRAATSTFTQTGGLVSVNDVIEVGASTGSNSNSSFSISAGSTTNGGNFFVGRGSTTGATVNISGTGILDVGNRFLMGGGTATGVTVNHTGGELKTDLDVRVGDAGTTDSTYYLSGTGVINTKTGGIVGRQGVGKFYQTGGEANFGDGNLIGTLEIGKTEGAPNPADGLYQISAGDLNVFTTLNVATRGTGQVRIIGDDATIDVTGDFSLGNTVDGLGTLAYELEGSELLSVINVTGTATFALGSSLVFDASNAAPTQTVYDLLTASSIVDNGIAFTGPPIWHYRIINGGNGRILQAVIPEPATICLALIAGVVTLRMRRRF
jgi:hypothetical protein